MWFEHVRKELKEPAVDLDFSWAAFHANNGEESSLPKSISTLLPLFHEESTSVPMAIHGMRTIMAITKQLNPGQTAVGCVDQPLYALFKQVQWNFPEEFGEKYFFSMFAGFHIEKNFIQVIGSLLEGSG